MFQQNLAIIKRRWPHIAEQIISSRLPEQVELVESSPESTLAVGGIQLSSRYDRLREARLQETLIPTGSSQAWVYGLATGDLLRRLLSRPELEQLNLVLMNLSVDRANFSHFKYQDWLADPRVSILTAEGENELKLPFACSPAFLYLADDMSARLRDLIYLELSTPYIRQQHSAREVESLLQLEENEPFVRQDGDVADLFSRCSEEKIVIAAAGPTLADQLGWMAKQRGRYRLVAVDAAVRALLNANIIPDYVLSIDSAPILFDLFFGELDLTDLSKTRLVYFPLVNKKILAAWPEERFAAYSGRPIFSALAKKHPRGELFSSGSVLHPAVDLAVKMKARQIILAGADFSFTKGQSHVSGSYLQLEMETNISCWVLNSRGERVPSSQNYVGYLRDLERYLAWHPEVSFFNASQDGAFIEGTFPFDGETYRWQ